MLRSSDNVAMYEGGKLSDLFGDGGPLERALQDMADEVGAEMTDLTRANTPVRSGRVRDSWRQKPVERKRVEGRDAYETGVESDHPVAKFVESGVRFHKIAPRDEGDGEESEALKTPEGPRAAVDHPGFRPFAPVKRAAAEVESRLPEITRPAAERWAQETEREAKRHKGIR